MAWRTEKPMRLCAGSIIHSPVSAARSGSGRPAEGVNAGRSGTGSGAVAVAGAGGGGGRARGGGERGCSGEGWGGRGGGGGGGGGGGAEGRGGGKRFHDPPASVMTPGAETPPGAPPQGRHRSSPIALRSRARCLFRLCP